MSATCPTCSERALILWYATGALQEDERTRVDRALSQCVPCQAALEETRMMAEAARTMEPAETLTPQQLVAFADTQSELSELNDSDREIVKVLREVSAGLELREQGLWERLLAAVRVRSWLSSPAVAYVLALALAYPAYLGISGAPITTDRSGPVVLSQPLELDTNARSAADNRVSISRADDRIVLTVFVAVRADYRYRLVLGDQSGNRRFVDEDAETLDGVGVFALLVPSRFLPTGDYDLVVDEIDPNGGNRVVETNSFPFRVE